MSVKRYSPYIDHTEDALEIIGAAMKEHVDGDYVLHSDYSAIEEERDKLAQEIMRLVNMNEQLHECLAAIVDAVAWERECRDANMGGVFSYATHHLWLTHGEDYLDAIQEDYEAICDAASAEVDRLLEEK